MSLATSLRKLPGLGDVRGPDDAAVIKDLEGLFAQAKNDREQYEPQWMLNHAFYRGQQWVFFNDSSRRIEKPKKLRKGQVLMTVNMVKGVVRTEYAKLTQQRPQAKAQPASGEHDDREQTKVADALLAYLDATDGSERAQKRALLWAIVTGTGILEVYWNKDKGETLSYPDTTMVELPDPVTGQPAPQEVPHPKAGQTVTDKNGDPVHLGDVEVCEISPFEFYPDPYGLSMQDKSWAFTVKIRSAEYVMERYGIEVEPHEISSDLVIEGQMGLIGSEAQPKKGVVVKTFRQRPTKKYPEGRYVVYVDSKVLVNDKNPYPKAPLPFASFVHIPMPGQFWGDSMITDLVDPQRNLNKSRSQAIEQRNMMARGRTIVAKGALDVGKTITNTAGELIEVNVVQGISEPVKFVDGTPISDSFWRDLQESKAEIRDVSGSHEVSNAQVPGGVTAAKAIGYLQEQDDMRLGPTAQDYEDAISEIATFRLALCKQFYDEPRKIRVAGKDNSVKVIEFEKEDIPENVDIRVETGSSLPKSRVARQHFVLELWQKKVPIPPRSLIRMLDLGDVEGLYDEVNRDIDQAERENDQLKQGNPVAAAGWHNHSVHIQEHDGFRKGEEYETLIAQNPQIAQIFADHDAQHQQLAAQVAQAAAMTGQPVPGQAAPAPGPLMGRPAPQVSGTAGDTAPMPALT